MTGRITNIHSRKKGNGAVFIRVTFSMLESRAWAKTDLCPTFRNFQRWKPYLVVGAVLSGLELKAGSRDTINADSDPRKISIPTVTKPVEQLDLL